MTFNKAKTALVHIAVTTALVAASVATAQNSTTSTQRNRGVAAGVDTPPGVPVYALTSDNSIYVLRPGFPAFLRLGRVETQGGNLIGIDFRPADRKLYGLTDLGVLYTIPVSQTSVGQATRVSTMDPRFTGGFGAVVDFNPQVNALRVMGSNDQNRAVLNGADGSNLTTTVAQTTFTYATGDVNFGKDPEIVGGAYSNNVVGATSTLFYLIDHDQDTLVTIAEKTGTGSSNTGNGKLQTIGQFFDEAGNRLNMSPTSDLDIYTDRTGKNWLVGQTSRLLFSIDLSQIDPNLPLGTTQRVVVKRGQPSALPSLLAPLTGGTFDIAMPPLAQ
jgi:Domain of unknown function (DUF4394)